MYAPVCMDMSEQCECSCKNFQLLFIPISSRILCDSLVVDQIRKHTIGEAGVVCTRVREYESTSASISSKGTVCCVMNVCYVLSSHVTRNVRGVAHDRGWRAA